MQYVLDVQGFKKPVEDYVAKELAILPLFRKDDPLVLLFKPPIPWRRLTDKYKKENTWLLHNFHGISWDSGNIEYDQIGNILREALNDATTVFVSGEMRKQWLERFNLKCEILDVNLQGYITSNFPKRVTICTNHQGRYKATCALHRVKNMKDFYLGYLHMDWE